MLDKANLKAWLHKKELSRRDKILLILASFEDPCSISDIKESALGAGLRLSDKWNISLILSRSNGCAIRVPEGWEITDSGKSRLRELGVSNLPAAAVQVASDLRTYLAKIANDEVRNYVEEAIMCHEAGLYKASIIMSWLAAISVLHIHVVRHHLAAFNAEATRVDTRWKAAKNSDDLGKMKEYDFLERLHGISGIGKNRKDELQKALKLRNACGHPNSFKVSANGAAAHIEMLLLNVFDVFQI
ncbi:Uncharacterized protein BN69_1725 [Methylocystis sp. SC2]|nr:Uncharacterized protein BN69_1725 [Methylocystis sp. SC2]